MDPIVVLGAGDREMAGIEALARDVGWEVVYAEYDGRRVTPDTAYRATGPALPKGREIIAVECDGPVFAGLGGVSAIDHHRPNDLGYGKSPRFFLEASSIGQFISLVARRTAYTERWDHHCITDDSPRRAKTELAFPMPGEIRWIGPVKAWALHSPAVGWRLIPREIILTAAADHCLGAAYRGQCHGVDPDELMAWRAEERARFQRRAVEEVLADIERATVALRAAPLLDLGEGQTARDMRGVKVAELPEAAARLGECFVSDGLPLSDGRVKVVCQSGSRPQIAAFLECWAVKQGLRDTYGDPARGFAGGYR